MNLDELKKQAKEDLAITEHENMDQESYKNQLIKPKWLEYKTNYEQLLIMRKTDHQKMWREKWEYYGGKADAKVYAAKPFDIKVLKNDLQMYIQSDDEILELQNKISYYESIIKYIEGIIRIINVRFINNEFM